MLDTLIMVIFLGGWGYLVFMTPLKKVFEAGMKIGDPFWWGWMWQIPWMLGFVVVPPLLILIILGY